MKHRCTTTMGRKHDPLLMVHPCGSFALSMSLLVDAISICLAVEESKSTI